MAFLFGATGAYTAAASERQPYRCWQHRSRNRGKPGRSPRHGGQASIRKRHAGRIDQCRGVGYARRTLRDVMADHPTINKKKIREAVRLLLEGIGEDPDREGLRETPDRVARMYEEIF